MHLIKSGGDLPPPYYIEVHATLCNYFGLDISASPNKHVRVRTSLLHPEPMASIPFDLCFYTASRIRRKPELLLQLGRWCGRGSLLSLPSNLFLKGPENCLRGSLRELNLHLFIRHTISKSFRFCLFLRFCIWFGQLRSAPAKIPLRPNLPLLWTLPLNNLHYLYWWNSFS